MNRYVNIIRIECRDKQRLSIHEMLTHRELFAHHRCNKNRNLFMLYRNIDAEDKFFY